MGGFRRLRAATYFAHGGSSSQWPRPPSLGPSGQFTLSPLVSISAWRRKLCPLPCSSSSRRSPAKRVRREEEEQGNERSFRRWAETEWSGLCDDEPPWAK